MLFQTSLFIFVFYLTIVGAQIETTTDMSATSANGSTASTNHCADHLQEGDFKYLGNVAAKQFFLFDNRTLVSWQDAVAICVQNGMVLVKISNKAEMDFVNQQVMTNKIGPVWFGARDIGSKSWYRWTPNVNVGSYGIDTFVNFSSIMENGPLALQMNLAVSDALFPSPSYLKTAKAFCQTYITYY